MKKSYFCHVSILHLTTIRLYAEGLIPILPRVLRGGIFRYLLLMFYSIGVVESNIISQPEIGYLAHFQEHIIYWQDVSNLQYFC